MALKRWESVNKYPASYCGLRTLMESFLFPFLLLLFQMLVTLIVNSLPGEWLGYSDNHLLNSFFFLFPIMSFGIWPMTMQQAGNWLRGEKKQSVLGYISKLLYIRCRWDPSSSQPGRKLLIKQHEVGGAAFDIVSWTLGREEKAGEFSGHSCNYHRLLPESQLCGRWAIRGQLAPWRDQIPGTGYSSPHMLLYLHGPVRNWWRHSPLLLDHRLNQVIHLDQWEISRYDVNIGLK